MHSLINWSKWLSKCYLSGMKELGKNMWRVALMVCLVSASSVGALRCKPETDGDGDGDGDADMDADTDGDGDGDSDADGDGDGDVDGDVSWPTEGCTAVDILFVVDDSGSMSEEQSNLARNFPEFISRLEAYRTPADTQLDYRVGVTTSSRENLHVDSSVTYLQGGPRCTETADCPNAPPVGNHTCECPSRGYEECSKVCPGNCYCEPPGTTMNVATNCEGEDGRLIAPSGYTEPWIQGPGDHVSTAFSSIAQVGTSGCGLEMPLYAVEHALSSEYRSAPGETNRGFLREDSLLMLIIITDEDDCSSDVNELDQSVTLDINHPLESMTGDNGCTDVNGLTTDEQYWPVEHYIDFLDELMGERSHWALAVIAGMATCNSAFGDAYSAHRLGRLVEVAGDNAIFSDICTADLTIALDESLEVLQIACEEFVLY